MSLEAFDLLNHIIPELENLERSEFLKSLDLLYLVGGQMQIFKSDQLIQCVERDLSNLVIAKAKINQVGKLELRYLTDLVGIQD